MNSIIIDNFDDDLIVRLQKRAEHSGRSLEAEAKEILRAVLTKNEENSLNLAAKIEQRFSHFGDFEIPIISRDSLREIPNFED
ncbi:plasmid stability protein [Okeania sp.]|uniref:FitA-like ribbon-helix-helix domain-containing protein n=1 Tax=Okeania sp. TaxID=3100323 RepID=UPI002B4B330F|nr:plasmid stability protein [Okeania sp.]MEB3343586.1 plasmid stability protein [Okeania sp.]